MLTREIDYAIRALLLLAQHQGEVVSTSVLAQSVEAPYRFLRRILLQLTEQGLVVSVRGNQGGVKLAYDPASISLLDIIRAVDIGVVRLNICLGTPPACPRFEHCPVHDELAEVEAMLHCRLAEVTLAGLARRTTLPGETILQLAK